MNALREEHIRAVGKGSARHRNTQTSRNRGQTSGKCPCNDAEKIITRHRNALFREKLGHIGPACRGGKPWQAAATATGKQATQSRARQVAPSETDDATPAGNESVQAVSRQADASRCSPSPAFYV